MALYDDAQVAPDRAPDLPADAGAQDAAPLVPDTGPKDTGPSLLDAGGPPQFAFSGVWSIFDQSSFLYAREVDQNLNLIVGTCPYVYTGTIAASGDFELQGNSLIRSGCVGARIVGNFDRVSSFYTLNHTSCNTQAQPFTADLRGSFQSAFATARSGVYRLSANIVVDLQGCYTGRRGPYEVIYGVSIDATTGKLAIFTAQDLIDQPMVYLGTYSMANDAFSAIHTPLSFTGPDDTALSARFEQFGSQDPVRLVGERDVIDPDTLCRFTMTVEGQRISAP